MTKATIETDTNLDAECLMAEVLWIEARALRLHAQHDLEMLEAGERPSWRAGREPSVDELKKRIHKLSDEERKFRKACSGKVWALDAIAEEHRLSEHEQIILLLAALPAVSPKASKLIEELDFHGSSFGITPETNWAFTERTGLERLLARRSFDPSAPLMAGGLIHLDCFDPNGPPEDLNTVRIRLSTKVFETLVGRASGD
jgi:hypothetical protein